ncbi:MAG: hypothetical protein AAB433_02885 [Nitrospirota bacterium]|jgi:hypothetical protein
MVTLVLAVTGLLFCQEPRQVDGGVVQVEPAMQWIFGHRDLCTPRTVLSPDGFRLPEQIPAVIPRPSLPPGTVKNGGLLETTIISPKPVSARVPDLCKTTLLAKPIDVGFVKEKDELTAEGKAVLTALLAESPTGVTVIGALAGSGEQKKTLGLMRARVQRVKAVTEALVTNRPTITQLERVGVKEASHYGAEGHVQVVGIFQTACADRGGDRRPVPPGGAPIPAAVQHDLPGGVPVAR